MMKTSRMILIVLAVLPSFWKCMDEIQLFHYIHPAHVDQVNYVRSVAEFMIEKREWNRLFTINENLCPQFTTEICPDGKVCKPPGEPPKEPPNVCDLDIYDASASCSPGGDCYDDGTCPVKLCDIPFDLRKVLDDGSRICEPDKCNPELVDPLPEDCRPVTRCDLKMYEGFLDEEECKDPDPCVTNPDNCINVCDVSGFYSPCGYLDCYKWPLPYCFKLPPPPPCEPDSTQTESDNECCVGLDCFTSFDRCLWGQHVGKRLVETLTLTEFEDNSGLNSEGNPVLDCVNKYTMREKQGLMFECFKDGILAEGFELVNKDEIESIVAANVKEGDDVVVEGQIEDHKLSVDLTHDSDVQIRGDGQ